MGDSLESVEEAPLTPSGLASVLKEEWLREYGFIGKK